MKKAKRMIITLISSVVILAILAGFTLLVLQMIRQAENKTQITFDVVNFGLTLIISVAGLLIAFFEWQANRKEKKQEEAAKQKVQAEREKAGAALVRISEFSKQLDAFDEVADDTFDTTTLSNCSPAEMGQQCQRVNHSLQSTVEPFDLVAKSISGVVLCVLENEAVLSQACVSLALDLVKHNDRMKQSVRLFENDIGNSAWLILEHESLLATGEKGEIEKSTKNLYQNIAALHREYVALLFTAKNMVEKCQIICSILSK